MVEVVELVVDVVVSTTMVQQKISLTTASLRLKSSNAASES